MTQSSDDDDLIASHGVVLRAKNDDVIRYDPTGLVLRLSDRVVEDLALRLPAQETATVTARGDAVAPPEGIDAWDARAEGEWITFTARLAGDQGVRGFRQHREGGDIIAEANGPLLGLLGIGGARAALATREPARYPHHIVAPADDIGAVGHAGIETAKPLNRLEHLREMTHEALTARTILDWRMADFGPLPLFMTRVETDASPTAAELATGRAVENLLVAARNLREAAALMGKKAKVLAVTLDFALEDHSDSAHAYRDGMLAVMEAVSDGLWAEGFDRPLFVARFESALPELAPTPALEGQWELSWNHDEHRLLHSAPAYMFARDAYDRPTETARLQQAEMTASAIAEAETWKCPTLHLAELEGTTLRVPARAAGALVLDTDDPLGAGPAMGFSLTGCTNDAEITAVSIAEDDPQSLQISLSKAPEGPDLRLAYTTHGPGALRDTWQLDSATGATLHRWALPAHLPITGGRDA
ncbi:hypothetical protein [Gymnodinialimonas ceratoperidinii]|uniref:Uncharacterized protein n=1 Tax=Gymnodinialimonas ceratoperidinii TaxID=2856823 RepID=A0A8F6YC46_9RHOB|nr:hypothetical protein [Gymnodinialimonas ceratoperidinii]QXT40836.1 hypothetical protein KYE46_06280 [Gymnodinialimonas ceratoperidinii]